MSRLVLMRGIVGSQAFGLSTPTSDTDYATVFMSSVDEMVGFGYKEHDDNSKDDRCYELNKFLRLLIAGNPNMLEILNLPSFETVSNQWFHLLLKKDMFITKRLGETFAGYAKTQLEKAQGLNKKINWEKQKMERKDVIDFCYVEHRGKSVPLRYYMSVHGQIQENYALVKLDRMRDAYAAYYIHPSFPCMPRGVCKEGANDVHITSVSEDCMRMCSYVVLSFNKDGYMTHCKDWADYEKWKREKNEDRFTTNKAHGQDYDSKNIMHVVRLMRLARRIVETGKVEIVETPESREYLLRIKRGQEDLGQLVEWARQEFPIVRDLYQSSSLPDEVNVDEVNKLMLKMRGLC